MNTLFDRNGPKLKSVEDISVNTSSKNKEENKLQLDNSKSMKEKEIIKVGNNYLNNIRRRRRSTIKCQEQKYKY